ncbi:MAG: 16S rRNA (adenine(1518)-N(6)/adenine(1519)-N(6))-dimethyltransferase RsmA [Chloroflexota bacterium]
MTDASFPPLHVPTLLRQYGLRPDKSLGQNFLVDEHALRRVVETAGITSQDDVLEIGPGLGSLTRRLCAAARQVVAVELDADLLAALQDVLAPWKNVRVVQGDILEVSPGELFERSGYKVVANIPYYITSAVIRHLLEAPVRPAHIVLTVQQEVAERIVAADGAMSILALSVQVYGRPSVAARIPAGAFYPPPKVDSAVLRIDLHAEPLIPPERLDAFFRLVKAGFGQKRKTLRNALAGGLHITGQEAEALLTAGAIDPRRRAETLDFAEWQRLTGVFHTR